MSGEEDAYIESHFHDVFNEDCIVLDPVSVLPLQYKITRNLLPLSGKSILLLLECMETSALINFNMDSIAGSFTVIIWENGKCYIFQESII